MSQNLSDADRRALTFVPEQFRESFLRATESQAARDPNFRSVFAAAIQVESGWNPNAVGKSGEIGLGQIMPATAQSPGLGIKPISISDLYDPEENLRFAARYYEEMLWRSNGDPALALQKYNAGIGGVNQNPNAGSLHRERVRNVYRQQTGEDLPERLGGFEGGVRAEGSGSRRGTTSEEGVSRRSQAGGGGGAGPGNQIGSLGGGYSRSGRQIRKRLRRNVLDDYENVRPIIAFKATTPTGEGGEIIIAETGRTAKFTIDEVSIEHVLTPMSAATLSRSATIPVRAEVSIQENLGFSLLERIIPNLVGVNSLSSWGDIRLVLEINYVGYESSGKPVRILEQPWKCSFVLSDIEIDTSNLSSGAKYKFVLVPASNQGLAQIGGSGALRFATAATIELTNNMVLQNALGLLAGAFNQSHKPQDSPGPSDDPLPYNLNFRYHPADTVMRQRFENLKINTELPNFNGLVKNTRGNLEFRVAQGTTLADAAAALFRSFLLMEFTPENQQRILREQRPQGPGGSEEAGLRFPTFDIEFITERTNEFAHTGERIINIDAYFITKQWGNGLNTRINQNIDQGNGHGIIDIVKEYNFLYTGKNTDIIDVSFDINRYFYQLLSPGGAKFSHTPLASRADQDHANVQSLDPNELRASISDERARKAMSPAPTNPENRLAEEIPPQLDYFFNRVPAHRVYIDNSMFRGSSTHIATPKYVVQASGARTVEMNAASQQTRPPVSVNMTLRGDPFWLGNVNIKMEQGQDFFPRNGEQNDGAMMGFVLVIKNPDDSSLDSSGILTPTETLSVFSGIYQAGIAGNSPGIINKFKDEQHIVELSGLMLIEESEEYFTGKLTPEPRQNNSRRTEDVPVTGEERRKDRERSEGTEGSETNRTQGSFSGSSGGGSERTDRSGNFNYVSQMRREPGVRINYLDETFVERANNLLEQQRQAINSLLPPDKHITQEEWANAHTITSAARTQQEQMRLNSVQNSPHVFSEDRKARALDINNTRAAALVQSRGLTWVTKATLTSDILARAEENKLRTYAMNGLSFHIDSATTTPYGIINGRGVPLPPNKIG